MQAFTPTSNLFNYRIFSIHMAKIKIIRVLHSFSKAEMRQFAKFVKSPVHNRHQKVIQLFELLRKHLASSREVPEPAVLYDKLFPGEPEDLKKLHHVSSYLHKVLEEFLAWNQWRSNPLAFQQQLAAAYRSHQLEDAFLKSHQANDQMLRKMPVKDAAYFRQLYLQESERYSYQRTKSKIKEFRLQELSNTLDQWYIAEKLKTVCFLLSSQNFSKIQYEFGLYEDLLDHLEGHELLSQPTISGFFYAVKTLTNQQDDQSFQLLKQDLDEHASVFSPADLGDLYIIALNYCIRRINMGESEFMKEAFEIYRNGMKSEIFLQNGQISPRTYSNIIMSGLRSNAFGWVENFIHEYKDALPEQQKEGFYNYNLARFYYRKNDFDKAMPLLLMMEYQDVILTCLGKILLAKMYYEQQEFEALNSLLNSFNGYVKRKPLLGYHKTSYLNFTRLLSKIIPGKQRENREALQQQLESLKIVAEKEWLQRQIGTE